MPTQNFPSTEYKGFFSVDGKGSSAGSDRNDTVGDSGREMTEVGLPPRRRTSGLLRRGVPVWGSVGVEKECVGVGVSGGRPAPQR